MGDEYNCPSLCYQCHKLHYTNQPCGSSASEPAVIATNDELPIPCDSLQDASAGGAPDVTRPQFESDAAYWGNRCETFEDRPKSWQVSYEDGADGCLPPGWYAEGLDDRGWKITAPFYHEYGPFDTEKQAKDHTLLVDASYLPK